MVDQENKPENVARPSLGHDRPDLRRPETMKTKHQGAWSSYESK